MMSAPMFFQHIHIGQVLRPARRTFVLDEMIDADDLHGVRTVLNLKAGSPRFIEAYAIDAG
jgi:hypothetical protein